MLYFVYRTGIFLATRCSGTTAYRLAEIYARFWYFFDFKRKSIIRRHLTSLLISQNKSSDINKLTFNTFLNFSKYLIEVFRIPLVDKEYIKNYVTPGDTSGFDKAFKEGKGVILFTAHFGNWELGGIAMSLLGYPATCVALAHKDPRINQLFLSRRESFQMKIIDLNQYAARECLKTLRENKLLALVGDEDLTEQTIELDFLGEKIMVPRGPASLSRATGAPVIPSLMIRQPDNRFVIVHEKAIYPRNTENQEEDINQLTKQYLESLAPYFLKYPDQWYRFR